MKEGMAMAETLRVGLAVLGAWWMLAGHVAAEEVTPVEKVLSNPSAFHRHDVVHRGGLKLIGEWQGKDTFGMPTCGSIFQLDDQTGEIPVVYIIRCDPSERQRVNGLAVGRVSVRGNVEAQTVIKMNSGMELRTRVMATNIRREEK